MNTDNVLEYIAGDRLEYVDMLELIRRGSAEVIYAASDGVLLRNGRDGAHIISAAHPSAAESMLSLIKDVHTVCSHQQFILPIAEQLFRLEVDMKCYQSAWLRPDPPKQEACRFPIEQADMRRLDEVDAMYRHGPRDYIAERIAAGDVFGCVDGGQLIACIGTHEEGAMGMLEVREEYRRLGLGQALFTFMTARQLQLSRIAYSHIETHNEASLAMHRKYGFEIGQNVLYWLNNNADK